MNSNKWLFQWGVIIAFMLSPVPAFCVDVQVSADPQTKGQENTIQHKVVLHVSDIDKVYLLAESVAFLREQDHNMNIAIVFNGNAVLALSKQQFYAEKIIDMADWVGACSRALAKNKLAQKDLAAGIEFIQEGGLVALVRLQEEGYRYIKI